MNEIIEKPEFKKLAQEGVELQTRANEIKIVDDTSRAEAAEFLKHLALRTTQVESLTEDPWRIALNAYEGIQQWRKGLILKFSGPKKTVAGLIGEWDLKIQEKRRKEAAVLEEKARKEAEEKRRKEIEAARKAKDKEAVEALKAAPIVVAPAAPRTQEPTKVEGVSSRFEWKLDVIFNPAAVPLAYHTIVIGSDGEQKCTCVTNIKNRIKSLGGAHGIPGVKAKQVPIVSGRG